MKPTPKTGKPFVPSAAREEPKREVDPERVAQGRSKLDKLQFQTTVSRESYQKIQDLAEKFRTPINAIVELGADAIDYLARYHPDIFGQIFSRRVLGDAASKNGHDSRPGASGEARVGGGEDPR